MRFQDPYARLPSAGEPPLQLSFELPTPWRDTASVTLDASYAMTDAGLTATVTNLGAVALDRPVQLLPATVAKPWGREVWFSGIEQRGESRVQTSAGPMLLSHYLALAPSRVLGGDPLLLLKILDADAGDLYLEVHDTKQEVYVAGAAGARLRLGMNQALRRSYGNDESFRDAFLAAARAFQAEPNSDRKEALDQFTEERVFGADEVISIPRLAPHSLRRGSCVAEFQTLAFERKILAAYQGVVTQDGWDTAEAVGRIDLTVPPDDDAARNFDVTLTRLAPRQTRAINLGDHYVIGILMSGEVTIDQHLYRANDAFLLPAGAGRALIEADTAATLATARARPDVGTK